MCRLDAPLCVVSLGTVDDPWIAAGVSPRPQPPGTDVCPAAGSGSKERTAGGGELRGRKYEERVAARRGGNLITQHHANTLGLGDKMERRCGLTALSPTLSPVTHYKCALSLPRRFPVLCTPSIWLYPLFLLSRLITPVCCLLPGLTLCCKCIVYKSILQIGLLSWIYMLLSPPGDTGLVINFAQGSTFPSSENKCWSIIALWLPPAPHRSLPPQSLYKPWGWLQCVGWQS